MLTTCFGSRQLYRSFMFHLRVIVENHDIVSSDIMRKELSSYYKIEILKS